MRMMKEKMITVKAQVTAFKEHLSLTIILGIILLKHENIRLLID